jgi:hypothetical protein
LLMAAGATADEAEARLVATAIDVGSAGWDAEYGYGLIQPAAALQPADGADLTAPVITEVWASWAANRPTWLHWTTDEPSYGQLCSLADTSRCEATDDLGTSHTVRLRGPGHAFLIVATDVEGNESQQVWTVD